MCRALGLIPNTGEKKKKEKKLYPLELDVMAHACNHNYLGDRGRGIESLRPALSQK
jgi:hypothetical protein